MQDMRDAPAQHQRGESASHARRVGVALALRIDPAVERIEHGRRGAAHFHGLGQVAKTVEETAHRGLGGDAAALGAADAVGDRRHHVAARLRQLPAEYGAAEILVALARSGFGGEADARLDAGNPLSHRTASAGRGAAKDVVVRSRHGLSRARPTSFLQLAMIIEEIAAGARCDDDRQIAGFAIERVVAAVGGIVPRDLASLMRAGLESTVALIVVDPDLPARAAGQDWCR